VAEEDTGLTVVEEDVGLREFWNLLGFRGAFALILFVTLTGVGIAGWITDGWITGLSIIIGAITAAIGIVTYGRAIITDSVFSVVAAALTIFGIFHYLDHSVQHTDESLATYQRAYTACASGDSRGCDEGMRDFMCQSMESLQDQYRAATSANINISLPKEISGIVDMRAQHNINMLPSECQPTQ
jgi:hypothetical protein